MSDPYVHVPYIGTSVHALVLDAHCCTLSDVLFRVLELDYKHNVAISNSNIVGHVTSLTDIVTLVTSLTDIVASVTSLTDKCYTSSQEHMYHHRIASLQTTKKNSIP